LDPKTEIALVSSLRKAAEGRLVVVIAHRLSTIRQASKIVFLEDGRLMEAGSHDELMAKDGGKYRQFVELQSNPDYG
jgi:ABC-type multidrug transport system fused ATPase/permease subunit